MNNQSDSYKKLEELITQENIEKISNLILSLSPFELTTIGTLLGYLFSINLTVDAQNSIGNFFELVGQIILTFNAQGSASQPPSPKQFTDLQNEVEMLKKKINELSKL